MSESDPPPARPGSRVGIIVAALVLVIFVVLFAIMRSPSQNAPGTAVTNTPLSAAPANAPAGNAPSGNAPSGNAPSAASPVNAPPANGPAPAKPANNPALGAGNAAPAKAPDLNALPPGHPKLSSADEKSQVSVQWLGEDCFYIQSPGSVAVVTDPFDPTAAGLPAANTGAHFVTVSSSAPEHNGVTTVHAFQGEQKRVLHGEAAQRGDLRVTPLPLRAGEFAYLIDAGGLRIAHLGGVRGPLTTEQIRQLGPVDLLLLPVGDGRLTPQSAVKLAQAINPRVVIPMAYATRNMPASAQELGGVDAFVKASPYPRTDKEADVMLVSKADLPPKTEIWTLRYGH